MTLSATRRRGAERGARRRGAAVILALAVLALLAAFAIALMSITNLEREASTNYVNSLRARLVASAGVERASGQLVARFSRGAASGPGEAWAFDHGVVSALPPLDADRAPLSFAGDVGATVPKGRDEYRVRIVDCSARIPINDAPEESLIPVLNALGLAIARTAGADPVRGRASEILWFRNELPEARFASMRDFRNGLRLVGFSSDEAEQVSRYVSIASWADPTSVSPCEATGGRAATFVPHLKAVPKAPVNLNLAPVEVIAALVSPIGARALRERPADVPSLQWIEDQDPRWRWGAFREDLEYTLARDVVFVGPLRMDAAWTFATSFVAERERRHGFTSWNEVEAWIDAFKAGFPRAFRDTPVHSSSQAASFLGSAEFVTSVACDAIKANLNPNVRRVIANPDEPSRLLVDKSSLVLPKRVIDEALSAEVATDGMGSARNRRRRPTHRLRAGERPADDAVTVVTQSYSDSSPAEASSRHRRAGREPSRDKTLVLPAATLEGCLGPMGFFELDSLGRVLGPPDGSGLREEVARDEQHVVVKLFSAARWTSQADLEPWGQPQALPPTVLSWPEARAIRDPSCDGLPAFQYPDDEFHARDPAEGRIALAPCGRSRTPVGIFGERPSFGAFFDTPRSPGFALDADLSDANNPAALGLAAAQIWDRPLVRDAGPLGADGVVLHAPQNAALLYRAACDSALDPTDPDPAYREMGVSAPRGGNIDMEMGGVELWYKPDYDWMLDDGTQSHFQRLFCGLLFASHCLKGGHSGTQMLFFRNTLGDLRLVRLYYEVVGLRGEEQVPLVRDPRTGERVTVREYIERSNASKHLISVSQQLVTKGSKEVIVEREGATPEGSKNARIIQEEFDTYKYTYVYQNGWGFPWPPVEIRPRRTIRYARRETAVPKELLRAIGKGEWHHLAVRWNDRDSGPEGLRIFVDGKMLSTEPHNDPSQPDQEEFCDLNQPPDEVPDCFMVGGILRKQQVEKHGVFKFERNVHELAHGTIDDVVVLRPPVGDPVAPPERFPDEGVYRRTLVVPAERDVQILSLAWTAALPARYGHVGPDARVLTGPAGSAQVEVSASSEGSVLASAVHSLSGVLLTASPVPAAYPGLEPALPLGGVTLERRDQRPGVGAGAQLELEVKLRAASFGEEHLSLATPALDDLTLFYRDGPPKVVCIEDEGR